MLILLFCSVHWRLLGKQYVIGIYWLLHASIINRQNKTKKQNKQKNKNKNKTKQKTKQTKNYTIRKLYFWENLSAYILYYIFSNYYLRLMVKIQNEFYLMFIGGLEAEIQAIRKRKMTWSSSSSPMCFPSLSIRRNSSSAFQCAICAYQWGKLDQLIFRLLQTMASISASRPPMNIK